MKNFIKCTKNVLNPRFGMIILLILIGSFQVEAQSRKTITQEEIAAVNTLFEIGHIGVKFDGWEINPDFWNSYNFSQRKNITEKLSIYYKNYTKAGKLMSGFCNFYNMATKEKIARWYKNEYKEY